MSDDNFAKYKKINIPKSDSDYIISYAVFEYWMYLIISFKSRDSYISYDNGESFNIFKIDNKAVYIESSRKIFNLGLALIWINTLKNQTSRTTVAYNLDATHWHVTNFNNIIEVQNFDYRKIPILIANIKYSYFTSLDGCRSWFILTNNNSPKFFGEISIYADTSNNILKIWIVSHDIIYTLHHNIINNCSSNMENYHITKTGLKVYVQKKSSRTSQLCYTTLNQIKTNQTNVGHCRPDFFSCKVGYHKNPNNDFCKYDKIKMYNNFYRIIKQKKVQLDILKFTIQNFIKNIVFQINHHKKFNVTKKWMWKSNFHFLINWVISCPRNQEINIRIRLKIILHVVLKQITILKDMQDILTPFLFQM
ncbi:hypothetical protein A3Q56_00871 [Intoshia linei]|uniref:Uncharacterized protein n=1 Tax=Intoshia linei TaxID=1819745 RepID=A0A177BCW4_9BILA|nr:hypothetical protein A3Q56_00871 [Intoshia linei]